MHLTDKEVEQAIKKMDYKGCRNCKKQIEPTRMCEWAERGGDGDRVRGRGGDVRLRGRLGGRRLLAVLLPVGLVDYPHDDEHKEA